MTTPSTYQQAIFDFISNGRGDAVVEAVAGSGKTQTLVWAAERLKTSSALFVAFNKHIATELGNRIPNMECKTIHSIGFAALQKAESGTRFNVQANKYNDLVRDLLIRLRPELATQWKGRTILTQDGRKLSDTIRAYANFARLTLTSPNNLAAMAQFYNLDDLDEYDLPLVRFALENGDVLARKGIIDFTDMIYLPVAWQIKMPRLYDWVFVDEAQDLNAAQLEIVSACRSAGGRMVFVGDRFQAIYGFSGATPDSIKQIVYRTGATTFPLSVCYRCPKSHIELAKSIVPHIEAADWATEGEYAELDLNTLFQRVAEGDLILSRKTAPLIGLCLELIGQRIPARVRGRDIAAKLVTLLKTIGEMKNFKFEMFPQFADLYKRQQVEKLMKREGNESRVQAIEDEVEALQAAYVGFNAASLDDLGKEIESLFTDDRPSVWLSTVHRAKGLEAERVFIIEPQDLPLTWKGQLDWQYEQEMNLKYVAHTRAKQALFIVNSNPTAAAAKV